MKPNRFTHFTCLLTFLLSILLSCLHASGETPDDVMFGALNAISKDMFGPAEFRALSTAIRLQPKESRLRLLAVQASYHRLVEGDPQASIDLIKPHVAAHSSGELRPATSWRLDSPECVVETARSLMDQGEFELALAGLDRLGSSATGLPRALAAETVADLSIKVRRLEDAGNYYKLAFKALPKAIVSGGGAIEKNRYIESIRIRLREKQQALSRQLDVEAYGPGYVAYREAQANRLKRGRIATAFRGYEALASEFAGTMYAEAGRAYSVKCLLTLAAPAGEAQREAEIAALEKERLELDSRIALARKRRLPRRRAGLLSAEHEALEKQITGFKGVPAGRKARDLAIARAKALLEQNPLGLYRAEVVFDIGDHILMNDLSFDDAAPWYSKSAGILDRIHDLDATLETVLPEKARAVSAPPADMYMSDDRGAIGRNYPAHDDLFNRETCTWYWAHRRSWAAYRMGAVHLVRGEKEAARKQFLFMREVDGQHSLLEAAGWGSTVERMLWDVEYNDGVMYGQSRFFNPIFPAHQKKIRQAALVVSMLFESQDAEEADLGIDISRRLLANEFGKLTMNQRAYTHYFMAGKLEYHRRDMSEIQRVYKLIDSDYRKARIRPWILMKRAQDVACECPPADSDLEKKAIKDFQELLRLYPNHELERQYTLEGLANIYRHRGERHEQSAYYYREIIRQYPNGELVPIAEMRLEKYKKAGKIK